MPNFDVNFDAPMTTAKVGGLLDGAAPTEDRINENNEPQEPQETPAHNVNLSQTVVAIECALKKLSFEFADQQRQLQTSAIAYAFEVVDFLLGSVDELVEQRLRKNIERVLESPGEVEFAKLFVHPECLDDIETLFARRKEADEFFEPQKILSDAKLSKGDCRVDFGSSGRLASLDQQLYLIRSRLEQTVRDQKIGGAR